MSCESCKTGFRWQGTPKGSETTLGSNKAYITGDSKSAAILLVHDIFGWTFNNLRLLADHFAEEANATVYLPDFFAGNVIDPETLTNPEKRAKFDIPAFLGKHGKDQRWPEIKAAAQALRAQYPKVGAVGYCYGGWAILKIGADPALADAVVGAHVSLVEKSELENVKVPVQLIAPEEDSMFTPELKEHANKVIPTLGVPYEYVFFPGMSHGFAAKADMNNEKQKAALVRAKRCTVNFFNEFLH